MPRRTNLIFVFIINSRVNFPDRSRTHYQITTTLSIIMPKSKKNKVVHLTQVKKKGKDHKEDLMKQLETYVAKFKNVYIFDFDQMKSHRIMLLRIKLKDIGKIYSGKISLVSSTLKTVGKRTNTNFDELLEHINGHKGLLFTDVKCNKLVELIDKEAPEFCQKLLGYSQIAPETKPMLVDDQAGDNEYTGRLAKDSSSEKADKKKKSKNRNISEKREVKFVKV